MMYVSTVVLQDVYLIVITPGVICRPSANAHVSFGVISNIRTLGVMTRRPSQCIRALCRSRAMI